MPVSAYGGVSSGIKDAISIASGLQDIDREPGRVAYQKAQTDQMQASTQHLLATTAYQKQETEQAQVKAAAAKLQLKQAQEKHQQMEKPVDLGTIFGKQAEFAPETTKGLAADAVKLGFADQNGISSGYKLKAMEEFTKTDAGAQWLHGHIIQGLQETTNRLKEFDEANAGKELKPDQQKERQKLEMAKQAAVQVAGTSGKKIQARDAVTQAMQELTGGDHTNIGHIQPDDLRIISALGQRWVETGDSADGTQFGEAFKELQKGLSRERTQGGKDASAMERERMRIQGNKDVAGIRKDATTEAAKIRKGGSKGSGGGKPQKTNVVFKDGSEGVANYRGGKYFDPATGKDITDNVKTLGRKGKVGGGAVSDLLKNQADGKVDIKKEREYAQKAIKDHGENADIIKRAFKQRTGQDL